MMYAYYGIGKHGPVGSAWAHACIYRQCMQHPQTIQRQTEGLHAYMKQKDVRAMQSCKGNGKLTAQPQLHALNQ